MHQHIPAVSAVFLFYSIHHFILAGTACRQYRYSLFLLHRELLLPEGGSLGSKHDEIRKELVSMCNLGEAIEENALRKGRSQGRKEGLSLGRREGKSAGKKEGQKIGRAERLVQNVEAAMKSFHLDLRTACEGLGSSLKEYEQAKKLLKG